MAIDLTAQIPRDGSLALSVDAEPKLGALTLLLIRTGSVPAFTSLSLSGDTRRYQIDNLSRHQRYRVAALGLRNGQSELSNWLTVTPRAGLAPLPAEAGDGLGAHLGRIERVTVMPQDQRLTVYWRRSPGFVDRVIVELLDHGRPWKSFALEPEVQSLALDATRGAPLCNGRTYELRVSARFADLQQSDSPIVRAVPATQGDERAQNRALPQAALVYPCLALAPEVQVFTDDEPVASAGEAVATLHCFHCRSLVEWQAWHLRCRGCGAEFIPNGRGDFLDLARLRFGTCRCCLPQKILIQRHGSAALCCSHSGKEHIRLADGTFALIEELPYGLCQCCRPRRPLQKQGQQVVCSRSGEKHRNEQGAWVLVPSAPVFDAAAIDDLLDAGLAEICSTGVSRGSAKPRSRR